MLNQDFVSVLAVKRGKFLLSQRYHASLWSLAKHNKSDQLLQHLLPPPLHQLLLHLLETRQPPTNTITRISR